MTTTQSPTTLSCSNPSAPANRWWGVGESLLIVCIFYVAAGSPPPGVNEPHYLCRLKHAADPDYCRGDFFLESPDAHWTFVVAFAWLTNYLSLPVLAWCGRLAMWTALAWAWRRLSWTVVPRPLYAALGAAVIITGIAEGNFAGEWLINGFEAKPIAYVFVLLGLRAWVLNRWAAAWVHLGIASAWHVLAGGWSVLILALLWLACYRREFSLTAMAPWLVLGGAIALLGVAPALALNWGQPRDVTTEAAMIYVFERLPHHLAPLHKSPDWIAERAGRHAIVVTLMVGLLLVRLADLRASTTSSSLWQAFRHDPAGRLTLFACGAMLLAIVGLTIEWMLWDHPEMAARLLRFYWFRLVDVAVPLALAALLSSCLAHLFDRGSRLAAAVFAVALAMTGTHLASETWDRVLDPTSKSDARMLDTQDWIDACRWIQENTPRDAVFLTPRHSQSFKWYASRAEVVTYKDIPQDAVNLLEWRRRRHDVFKPAGNSGLPWARTIGQLGTRRVRELAERYQFNYVIARHAYPLALPVVYQNETYVVYRVDG